MIPSKSAAIESPAMRPPPTSEVVDMSSGSSSPATLASAFFAAARLARVFHADENTPPTPHQMLVVSSTKPANDDA